VFRPTGDESGSRLVQGEDRSEITGIEMVFKDARPILRLARQHARFTYLIAIASNTHPANCKRLRNSQLTADKRGALAGLEALHLSASMRIVQISIERAHVSLLSFTRSFVP
jgi:hypothetical protein